MIERYKIYNTLSQHLYNNFSKASNVAWENVAYTITPDETYFSEYFIPNDSDQVSVGTNGYVKDYGMYQINIRTKLGIGSMEAQSYIQELTALFKEGSKLTLDGNEVVINSTTPSGGFKSDSMWVTPFTITWSCYMTRN